MTATRYSQPSFVAMQVLPTAKAVIEQVERDQQVLSRVGGDQVRASVGRAQPLTPVALTHPLGAYALALPIPLLHDAQPTTAATIPAVDDSHPSVQRMVGQCLGTETAHPPLAVSAARDREHLAQPNSGVLIAMLIDFQAYFIVTL